MNPLTLALALAATIILHTGDRIAVEGEIREERGLLTFRSDGLLYSIPVSEVASIERLEKVSQVEKPVRRLRVSPEERVRLLKELEDNHKGTPAQPQESLQKPPAPPSPQEAAAEKEEQRQWRRRALHYEEGVRRALEDLQLLEERAEELQSKIQSLVSLGYKPRDFSWDTTQLTYTLEQIPRARLNVQRAERAYAEFREEARREGVLPGWLR